MQLRWYQQACIDATRASFRSGHRAILYRGETGSGKTEIFTEIARRAAPKGTRIGILLHRRELLRQTCERLHAPHGIINSAFSPNYVPNIQIATVQTLVHRLDRYAFDLLIIDEAHHAKAKSWMKIIAANPAARVLGFTATPERLDGKPLNDIFEVMIEGPPCAQLISEGWLSPFEVWAPSVIDTTGVRTRAGDYAHDELAAACDKPRITGDVVKHYSRYADGLPALAFAVSVPHAYHIAEEFSRAGYRFVAVEAKTSDKDRDAALRDLAEGVIHGVVNVDLFGEGVDVPAVECVILTRPTQSLALSRQQIGRGLRVAPGKTRTIILDHAGNTLRHGLPDEPIAWSLEGREQRAPRDGSDVITRQCPSCYFVHRPRPVCPQCGYVYGTKPREVEQVEGDLSRIERTPEQIARMHAEAEKQRIYLERIAAARGYKPGWAKHVLAARMKKRGLHITEAREEPVAVGEIEF